MFYSRVSNRNTADHINLNFPDHIKKKQMKLILIRIVFKPVYTKLYSLNIKSLLKITNEIVYIFRT